MIAFRPKSSAGTESVLNEIPPNLRVGDLLLFERKVPSSYPLSNLGLDSDYESVNEPALDRLTAAEEIRKMLKAIQFSEQPQHDPNLARSATYSNENATEFSNHCDRLENVLFKAWRCRNTMFRIVALSGSTIQDDIRMLPVRHYVYPEVFPANNGEVFQIYGDNLVIYNKPQVDRNPRKLHQEYFGSHCVFINPSAEKIRITIFGDLCAGGCKDGWLPDFEFLPVNMRREAGTRPAEYRPICPFCLGQDLMQQQGTIRTKLAIRARMDSLEIVTFIFRLNDARRAWNYGPYEFTSTDWFTSLRVRANIRDVRLHPAVSAALPRIYFKDLDVRRNDQDHHCHLCMCDLESETVVVKLACGHVFCDDTNGVRCISLWFESRTQCPTCHLELSHGPPLTYDELMAQGGAHPHEELVIMGFASR